jgi:hypothetical protein
MQHKYSSADVKVRDLAGAQHRARTRLVHVVQRRNVGDVVRDARAGGRGGTDDRRLGGGLHGLSRRAG